MGEPRVYRGARLVGLALVMAHFAQATLIVAVSRMSYAAGGATDSFQQNFFHAECYGEGRIYQYLKGLGKAFGSEAENEKAVLMRTKIVVEERLGQQLKAATYFQKKEQFLAKAESVLNGNGKLCSNKNGAGGADAFKKLLSDDLMRDVVGLYRLVDPRLKPIMDPKHPVDCAELEIKKNIQKIERTWRLLGSYCDRCTGLAGFVCSESCMEFLKGQISTSGKNCDGITDAVESNLKSEFRLGLYGVVGSPGPSFGGGLGQIQNFTDTSILGRLDQAIADADRRSHLTSPAPPKLPAPPISTTADPTP